VMNHKWLISRLGELPPVFDERQIAVISGKLERQCRDVEE
jgi:hypothetical protein